MTEVLTDRWAFTAEELENPSACTADDLFYAETFPESERDEPVVLLVNRRGECLKQHVNGTYSVIIEMRDDLDLDVLIKTDEDSNECYLADQWRNVIIDRDGKFLSFIL
jgi:hypothetical protein